MANTQESLQHLGLDRDQRFSNRQYRIQRVGRIVFAVILIAALAGLFGGGPIASVSRSSDDGSLRASYDRFLRRDSDNTVIIELTAPAGATEVRLSIEQGWFESVSVSAVTPEPDTQESRNGRIDFVFPVADPATPVQVILTYTAQHAGPLETAFATGDGQSVDVWQFIFP